MNDSDGGKPVSEGCLQILLIIAIVVMAVAWITNAFEDPTMTQSPSPSPSATAVAR